MSLGPLLVYVAILAVDSGGNGILLPNIVAGIIGVRDVLLGNRAP